MLSILITFWNNLKTTSRTGWTKGFQDILTSEIALCNWSWHMQVLIINYKISNPRRCNTNVVTYFGSTHLCPFQLIMWIFIFTFLTYRQASNCLIGNVCRRSYVATQNGIKLQEKPCMNSTEISLQWGTSKIMTLPKMSRCTFSKFLSNHSFPYFRLTPKAVPAWWNVTSFQSALLVSPVFCIMTLLLPRTVYSIPCNLGCRQIPLSVTNHQWRARMAASNCRTGTKWSWSLSCFLVRQRDHVENMAQLSWAQPCCSRVARLEVCLRQHVMRVNLRADYHYQWMVVFSLGQF